MKLNKKTLGIAAVVAFSVLSQASHASYMYYYYDYNKNTYKICKDNDGYLVYKPNGGVDAHGTGYTWSDVKSQYGINKWYKKSSKYYTTCP